MTQLTGEKAWSRIGQLLTFSGGSGTKDPLFKRWKHDCLRAIAQIDGEKSSSLRSFEEIDFEGNSFGIEVDEQTYRNHFRECVAEAHAILQSIQQTALDEMNTSLQQGVSTTAGKTSPSKNKKVFIVHGHNEELKTQVSGFLERLELEPIILHEQANQGQTIIEKFERHSDVAFAVVLLTPDDAGGKSKGKASFGFWEGEIEAETLKFRARQNVILELGFFLGKLGRAKVCGLYCEDVELPSDYNGVAYTKVDATNSWQQELLRELRAAGFDVDAKRLI